tara:strand:+ start:349 stop:1113 length:765 start_codon:yes stop_codon:yes gene_type:complete
MNTKKDLIESQIKDVINYLDDVHNGGGIEKKNQDFFVSPEELEKILGKYFLFFKNNNELISAVKHNYNIIKDMSFHYEAFSYIKLVNSKGKSIPEKVYYKPEQHNSYSHRIHSYLMQVFEDKLGINEKKEYKHAQITIEKKQYLKDLFKDSNNDYSKIIELLIKHDFLVENDDNTFDWKGSTEEPQLKPITSICILTVLLYHRNYIRTNLTNRVIAIALSNTFHGITVSPKIYGENKTNFETKKVYSNPFFFIS